MFQSYGAVAQTFLTGKEKQPALNRASDGLQFNYVHGLADVHGAGHTPQGAPDIFSHLLNCEHLKQLVKDVRETVQQRCLGRHYKHTHAYTGNMRSLLTEPGSPHVCKQWAQYFTSDHLPIAGARRQQIAVF